MNYDNLSLTIMALFILMGFATFKQKIPARRYTTHVVVMSTVGHDLFFGHIDNGLYYVTAALADLLIIIMLGFIANPIKMTLHLVYVNLAFIATNAIGFFMWLTYQPSNVYVTMCAGLHLITLYIMIMPDKTDYTEDGRNNDNVRYNFIWARFRRYISSRRLFSRKDEG